MNTEQDYATLDFTDVSVVKPLETKEGVFDGKPYKIQTMSFVAEDAQQQKKYFNTVVNYNAVKKVKDLTPGSVLDIVIKTKDDIEGNPQAKLYLEDAEVKEIKPQKQIEVLELRTATVPSEEFNHEKNGKFRVIPTYLLDTEEKTTMVKVLIPENKYNKLEMVEKELNQNEGKGHVILVGGSTYQNDYTTKEGEKATETILNLSTEITVQYLHQQKDQDQSQEKSSKKKTNKSQKQQAAMTK